jgi:tetratricopeptide (TPR) repeat protein
MKFSLLKFKLRKTAIRCAVIIGLIAIGGVSFLLFRAHRGLSTAKTSVRRQDWALARQQLGRYLWLYPNDSQARILIAEALVRDDDLTVEEGVLPAIDHLQRVSESAPQFAEARMREGRLRFLILLQPGAAEKLFRQAVAADPKSVDANLLLWKLLDMTGRQSMSGPSFWRLYDLTPERSRGMRLREWYLSEFHPGTANFAFDEMMGFVARGSTSSEGAVFKRLLEFREQDPKSQLTHAALAGWFRLQGDPQHALFLLQQAPKLDALHQDPFFLATRVEVLIDLGEFERATEVMKSWPKPHSGYSFWRCRGIVNDEVLQDFQTAITDYSRALAAPPGKTDWPMMERKAHCLVLAQRTAEAAEFRKKAKVVEKLMERDVHQRMRRILTELQRPEGLLEMCDFYRKLGRTRELESWQRYVRFLKEQPPVFRRSIP